MELNASKIKQLRTEKAWTQQQLAEICGLSLRTIQRVELNGIASLETSKALAVAFSIDRNELIQPIEPSPANEKARSQLLPLLTFILGFIAGTLLLGLLS